MKKWKVVPSKLKGTLSLPPSKSQSMRALLFGLLARGKSVITHPLPSPDMIHACRLLGAEITEKNNRIEMIGVSKIEGAEDVINAGNSGLILRLIGAIAALSSKPIVITGDHSIRHRRPVLPLLEGLTQLGATATSLRGNGRAPIYVKGPLSAASAKIKGADSQPVSGLLIAAAFAPHPIELFVTDPGERPWVRLTLSWLDRFQIPYRAQNEEYFRLEGGANIEGFSYEVPADFSSLAFPLVAALITNSEARFENLDFQDPQGDKQLISILESLGARLEKEDRALIVKRGSVLEGRTIDVNDCIDTLPILAVLGCFAEGETVLTGGEIARKKECDRIQVMASELKKMGASIEERKDGLVIRRSNLKGGVVNSYHDHRIALALTVAALAAKDESVISDIACVSKTYPDFQSQMQALGANIL